MTDATTPRPLSSWEAAASWHVPTVGLSWAAHDAWAPTFDRAAAASAARLAGLLTRWDKILAHVGGDPTREDWSAFRPLRLSREEDWSDWLAHLLERSRSGQFPARLFANTADDGRRWLVVRAEREVVAQDYRADLVVRFADGDLAHIEVKAGDLALAKTPGTGAALRCKLGGSWRGDYLLLPPEHVPNWETTREELDETSAPVEVRTWREVARALRRCAASEELEPVSWRVWALAFAGAIEQRLLGFRAVAASPPEEHPRVTRRDIDFAEYLEDLIDHDSIR